MQIYFDYKMNQDEDMEWEETKSSLMRYRCSEQYKDGYNPKPKPGFGFGGC